MNRKGFTLLELILVVIILGILASLGTVQYTKMIEKGRTAEAKIILGQIRTAQEAYKLEFGTYASALSNLPVSAPTTCPATGGETATHYFAYSADGTAGTATRCGTDTGKSPGSATAYTITLNYATGAFGGSAGYY